MAVCSKFLASIFRRVDEMTVKHVNDFRYRSSCNQFSMLGDVIVLSKVVS